MVDQFQPESWLVSGFNSLTDYINAEINASVQNDLGADVGLQLYELVMDFPTSDSLPKPAEFTKTIIHLAIDDIDNRRLGFGPGFVNATFVDAAGVVPGTVTEEEGNSHEINFDVGVWASDKSGGTSSRLRAYEMLYNAFGTDQARQRCTDFTDGVEIRSFNNGRFIIEKPNDVRLFRMIGAELVVRVYSRTVAAPDVIVDGEPVQQPDVEIGGVSVT